MGLRSGELLIDDGNYKRFIDHKVDGVLMGHGCIDRNYDANPVGCLSVASAFDFPLIPQSEYSARIKERIALRSQLSDIREIGKFGQRIPSLSQGRWGFCWAHSTVQGLKIIRALNNQPYVPLSAFMVASLIKGYRDEGGFNAESLSFACNTGVTSEEFWPEGQVDRRLDTPTMRANASLHKCSQFTDLSPQRFDQLMTLLLMGIPVMIDLMWWRHSVLAMDPVEIESNSFGARIWNSWSDSWGTNGMAVLTQSKATPDAAAAPRVLTASVV